MADSGAEASRPRDDRKGREAEAYIDGPIEEDIDEDAPNFAPSGLLAAESNTVNGVALKYHEPPEARKPKSTWRMYCFKDGKEQEVLHLGAQSAYLLGRDRTVVDIPLDHESCSKQHAVLQFQQTITTNEFGDRKKRIGPFLIDLESSNGSYVNENEIPTSRYYQLRTGDTLTFGASTREYVLLDESAA
uniref:FHA domain-containing protein n=1 Tax=Kalmanozyma brasiliensis (strain GHG001) TaxID=1365824 RepID=V5GWE8_KALBG